MNLLNDFLFDQEIDGVIEKNLEDIFLNKASIYCNNAPTGTDVWDLYFDLIEEKKKQHFDDFSAKHYALRKTFDYLFYGEALKDELQKDKIREEIKRTNKGFQDIGTLIKKYVELHPHIGEEDEKETLNYLNKIYFEQYYKYRKTSKGKEWMIRFLTASLEGE
ncbi:MAG: hypothetical protein KC516_02515 [Nanoarchaeota archaeon]|nr:hypothetical protein [Nanoarchaeota archaeon]